MTSKSAPLVLEHLTAIRALLDAVGERELSKVFATLERRATSEPDAAYGAIRSLFGGMGSFNDLVLHRNGTPLQLENEILQFHRRRLFEVLYED